MANIAGKNVRLVLFVREYIIGQNIVIPNSNESAVNKDLVGS